MHCSVQLLPYSLALPNAPGSLCTFPARVLESAFSPRALVPFIGIGDQVPSSGIRNQLVLLGTRMVVGIATRVWFLLGFLS